MSRYAKNRANKAVRRLKHDCLAYKDLLIDKVCMKSLYEGDSRFCVRDSVDEFLAANAYYGLASAIRGYAGYNKPLPVLFEHGLYPTHAILDSEIQRYNLPCVLTLGRRRSGAISSKMGWPVLPIGPYICYAAPFLSNTERTKLKARLGKTLMFIPGHGLEENSILYDTKDVIGQVRRIARDNGMQTVIVCLYFADLNKYSTLYEDAGFRVVCCGHRLDSSFLSRQRTYFEISDLVVTNAFGTYIGYALSLGKPLVYLNTNVEYELKDSSENEFEWKKDIELKKIPELFSEVLVRPSREQLDLLDGWWGFSNLRTPEELLRLLEFCEEVHESTRFSDASYRHLFLSMLHARGLASDSDKVLFEAVGEG